MAKAQSKPKGGVTPKKKAKKESAEISQAKLRKVLLFISYLKKRKMHVDELAQLLDTSDRTIYRYIKLLESVDFPVEKDFHNRYFLIDLNEGASTNNLFTLDELNALKKIIKTTLTNSPLKKSLQKKLGLYSELETLPDLFIKIRNGAFIEQLSDAIKQGQQVILRNYHSANSHKIEDRLIEPIDFGGEYATVIALDTKDKKCKQFKLERIGEIIPTGRPFKYENLHQKSDADPFGWMGVQNTIITLLLDLKAYLAMREMFPATLQFLTALESEEDGEKDELNSFRYQFHGPVKNFEGVGRFVLGMMAHIRIVNSQEFKIYIQEQLKASKLFE